MVISILNFNNGSVDILHISHELENKIDSVEDYLSKYYNLEDILYMTTDSLNLNIKEND